MTHKHAGSAGADPGRERSVERAQALKELRDALADVPFPVHRDDLLRLKGDTPVHIAADGSPIPLRSFLQLVGGHKFASPAHVAEAVDLNWHDFSDVYTLGASEARPMGMRHTHEAKRPQPRQD